MYLCHNKYYFFSVFTLLLNLTVLYAYYTEEEVCGLKNLKYGVNCTGLKSYQPWPDSETCSKYTVVLPKENTYEPRAVASFVASGVAWFLQVIERGTGFVANDFTVYPAGLTPRSEIRCGLKVWTGISIIHGNIDEAYGMLPMWYRKIRLLGGEVLDLPTLSNVFFKYRGILLIRNPWHAIINSRPYIRNMLRKCNSCRSPKLEDSEYFKHENFQIHFENAAKRWVKHVMKWVRNSPHGSDMIIIRYENLMKNPEPEVRKVLHYLNITADEDRLNCVFQDPGDFIEHFPVHNRLSSVATFFEKNIDSASTIILQNGILEINKILHERGISEFLDYSRPTHSDILATNSRAFFTRSLIP